MNTLGYKHDAITRDSQAKAMVRGMAEVAQELIDGGNIAAAADRLETAADRLRDYLEARTGQRRSAFTAPRRVGE